jgi:hypothetical protein
MAASEWSWKPRPPLETVRWARSQERDRSGCTVSVRWGKRKLVAWWVAKERGECHAVREGGEFIVSIKEYICWQEVEKG